jgi:hypothetical protein
VDRNTSASEFLQNVGIVCYCPDFERDAGSHLHARFPILDRYRNVRDAVLVSLDPRLNVLAIFFVPKTQNTAGHFDKLAHVNLRFV